MNVNKYSFTKYIDFWFFQFLHKRKSFTRLATKKWISKILFQKWIHISFARSSSRNQKWVVRFSFDRSKLAVRNLETVKTGEEMEFLNNLFSPLDNILLELLKSNRGNEEKSSRMVKKGIKVFRADLPTNLSENSYWIDLGQGNK